MEELVEVVEEEVAVDDTHLHYADYYDNQYEYVIEEDAQFAEQNSHPDTSLIKIKAESLDPTKHKFRVPATDITDDLYTGFCEKVVNPDHKIAPSKQNDKLDSIYHSGDWAIARKFPDALLGELEEVMVHLPTSKFLVKEADKQRLLTESIGKHQNSRNPVGNALQDILKSYLGMPPIGELRNMLSNEMCKVFPLHAPVAIPHPTNRKLAKRVSGWKMGYGPKKKKATVEKSGKEAEEEARPPPSISPIDDEIYEELAEVIASGQRGAEQEFDWPMPIKALLAKGALVAEHVDHLNVDLEEVIRDGWCIRERATGRIVPRKTDVKRIWQRIRDRMILANSMSQIVAYVDAKFVGIASGQQIRAARMEDLYKGPRVIFPQAPTVIGRRPMQFVQIDIMAPFNEYHSEEMECALVIVDLHSHYAFCKPLIELTDNSTPELLRFMYESFAAFGPPEAFVISSEKNWEYISEMMIEVENHYKVRIKVVGFAKDHPSKSAISSDALTKAGGEGGFRWIDTLHSAVMEWNQRPNKIFDYKLSPFEVMFGRPVWRDCSSGSRLPPWIPAEERKKRGAEVRQAPDRRPLKERIETTLRELMAPDAKMDERGTKVLDPGTGMRYEIGDRVYVRNIHYVERSSDPGKVREKREECRYFRGVVVEEDPSQPEFFYRVAFASDLVDQDVLAYEAWPTIHHDTNDEVDSAWFSPWDLAPSSFDLQCRRTTNPPKEVSASRCGCELEYCDLLVDEECARGMSHVCCARHEEGPCRAHQSVRRRCGRKRKEEETEEVRVTRTMAEVDGDARYIFRDGALVRITQVARGQMELPEEILQE